MTLISQIFAMIAVVLSLTACNTADKASSTKIKSAIEVENSGQIKGTELYRNPVTADQPVTTDRAAKMEFEEYVFDFGTVKEGDKVEHKFEFKNVGKVPLVITNARGNCGCTVPEWPKDPVLANASSHVKVVFDSDGKNGNIEKEIIISANTIPNRTKIKITGKVVK